MNLIFQILLLSLIVFSFITVISISYFSSITNGWNDNKKYILISSTIWFILVFAVGILNSFVI